MTITIKQGIKLSAIIDKLEIGITNPEGDAFQIAADLIVQVISKAHKAETEIYSFISDIKNVTSKEAEKVDLAEFINEVKEIPGIKDFFKSAEESDNLA